MADEPSWYEQTIMRSSWYRERQAEANRDRVDDGAGGCLICDAAPDGWCDRVVHEWPEAFADEHDEAIGEPS